MGGKKPVDKDFYLIKYFDSQDIREPRVFTGWFKNGKVAVNEFARRRFHLDGEHFHESNMNHTLEQIINKYNLYHNKSKIVEIWSNPVVIYEE